jgi:hypothetical protein
MEGGSRNSAGDEPFGCELRAERLSRVECGRCKLMAPEHDFSDTRNPKSEI